MGFLDDVVKGVNTGIKQVGDGLNKIQSKSQEMMNPQTLVRIQCSIPRLPL